MYKTLWLLLLMSCVASAFAQSEVSTSVFPSGPGEGSKYYWSRDILSDQPGKTNQLAQATQEDQTDLVLYTTHAGVLQIGDMRVPLQGMAAFFREQKRLELVIMNTMGVILARVQCDQQQWSMDVSKPGKTIPHFDKELEHVVRAMFFPDTVQKNIGTARHQDVGSVEGLPRTVLLPHTIVFESAKHRYSLMLWLKEARIS